MQAYQTVQSFFHSIVLHEHREFFLFGVTLPQHWYCVHRTCNTTSRRLLKYYLTSVATVFITQILICPN